MNKFLLVAYFKFFRFYQTLRSIFFSYFPVIYVVWDIRKQRSLTLNYYLGLPHVGDYLVKIITEKSTHMTLYTGYLREINAIEIKEGIVQRKDIILLDEETVLDLDLNILDDFYIQTVSDISLAEACSLLGCRCTKVKIIDDSFGFEQFDAADVKLGDLYLS